MRVRTLRVLYVFPQLEASQGPEWHKWVDVYKELPSKADARASSYGPFYVVVDVRSNSGTSPDNPSIGFTASRDMRAYKLQQPPGRLLRTYGWRSYTTATVPPIVGARAAAGENGRYVKLGDRKSVV